MDLATRLYLRRPPRPVFRGVLQARSALRRLRSRLVPANAELIERTLAIAEVRALGIAADLDIADRVAVRPRTSAELAAELSVDADALDRVLALLSATGYFRRGRDQRWRNTRLSAVLRADHPLAMRGWARFFGGRGHLRIWADADHAVRTGASAAAVATGVEFFEWLSAGDGAEGRHFDQGMADASRLLAMSFARTVDLSDARSVCDVGGGTGGLLREVLAHHRGVRAVLFDLPAVVAAAPRLDGMEVVGGSFFEGVPPGCDRYVLVSVVHDWDDERAAQVLRACREALPDGGRVLVVEQVDDPSMAPMFQRHTDVLMLVLTGAGRERTEEEFTALFRSADLTVTRTWELATLHRVYELAPA